LNRTNLIFPAILWGNSLSIRPVALRAISGQQKPGKEEWGNCPAVFPNSVNSANAAPGQVKPGKEAFDVLYPVSSVTPRVDAIGHYSSFVTPAPQRIGVDVEELSYFSRRKHFVHILIICHFLLHLLLNQLISI
jgi:hypothetical protein